MKNSVIYIIAALTLLASCAGSADERRLDHAAAIMEVNADSVAAIVKLTDTTTLSGRAAALYALLDAHSRYRLGYNDTDDSAATVAVEYFTAHSDRNRRLLTAALFIQGRNRFYAGRNDDAMVSAARAMVNARVTGDSLYQAHTHVLMGDIYERYYQGAPAAQNYHEAATIFKALNMPLFVNYAFIDEADALGNLSLKTDSAFILLDSIKPYINIKESDGLKLTYNRAYILLLYNTDQYQRADSIAGEMLNMTDDDFFLFPAYAIRSMAALERKEISAACAYLDSAEYCLISSPGLDGKFILSIIKERLVQQESDIHDLLDEKDSIISAWKIITDSMGVPIFSIVQRVENEHDTDIERQTLHNRRLAYVVSIILCIFIMAGGIISYMIRRKMLRRKEAHMDDMRKLNEQNMALADKLNSQIVSIVPKINEICDELFLYNKENLGLKQKVLYKNICRQIQSVHTSDIVEQLEEHLIRRNIISESNMTKLRELMRPDEFEFMLFNEIGFSAKSLCIIFPLSISGVYYRRSKITQLLKSLR